MFEAETLTVCSIFFSFQLDVNNNNKYSVYVVYNSTLCNIDIYFISVDGPCGSSVCVFLKEQLGHTEDSLRLRYRNRSNDVDEVAGRRRVNILQLGFIFAIVPETRQGGSRFGSL